MAPPPAGNSTSWASARTLEGARLVRLQNLATHINVYNSPYFPKNIGEYVAHLREIQAEKLGVERKKIQNRIEEIGQAERVGVFLNGKSLEFVRVDVLGYGQEKVWPFGHHPFRVDAIEAWPTKIESKLEGEYRSKAGLKRRFPAPRQGEDAWLVNNTLPLGVAVELTDATREDIPPLIQDASGKYDMVGHRIKNGMKELEMRRRQEYPETWTTEWHDETQEEDVEEYVPDGGWKFNEEDLSKTGAWVELLDDLWGI
jgi:hypothetical protein